MRNKNINLDKLKLEDRELLLRLSFDRSINNSNNRLVNNSVFIAICSLVISTYAVILTLKDWAALLVYVLVAVPLFLWIVFKFYSSQSEVKAREQHFSNQFDKLFFKQFGYAFTE